MSNSPKAKWHLWEAPRIDLDEPIPPTAIPATVLAPTVSVASKARVQRPEIDLDAENAAWEARKARKAPHDVFSGVSPLPASTEKKQRKQLIDLDAEWQSGILVIRRRILEDRV